MNIAPIVSRTIASPTRARGCPASVDVLSSGSVVVIIVILAVFDLNPLLNSQLQRILLTP
jgi:hypothetical protein